MIVTPITYDDIKTLAAELGRPAETLIALAAGNDPSIAARPVRLWRTGSRIRSGRCSTRGRQRSRPPAALSRGHPPPDRQPAKLDGTPYENTHEDWKTISDASLAARELGLIDADRFVDRRAGEPTYIFIPTDEASEADVFVTGNTIERPSPEWAPRYTPKTYVFPPLPSMIVFSSDIVEDYAIEIWAEKSTMNDVLEPLARRLGVSLVTGVGELSHTHCNKLVKRVAQAPAQDPHPLYQPISIRPATACRSRSPARSSTSCAATVMKISISGSTRWS